MQWFAAKAIRNHHEHHQPRRLKVSDNSVAIAFIIAVCLFASIVITTKNICGSKENQLKLQIELQKEINKTKGIEAK
jgi:cell division protein FtsX